MRHFSTSDTPNETLQWVPATDTPTTNWWRVSVTITSHTILTASEHESALCLLLEACVSTSMSLSISAPTTGHEVVLEVADDDPFSKNSGDDGDDDEDRDQPHLGVPERDILFCVLDLPGLTSFLLRCVRKKISHDSTMTDSLTMPASPPDVLKKSQQMR
ncbi:hypothetical protein Pelo_9503 [Pelomyxa schiedti]|nr:hypothetical protein Pelo_9503 [Pelomyxa schiedti]